MGNCSSTSNCNPCGPDFNAINQLATKTASYARQANTYATDAKNAWLEFNALYLGAFVEDPEVDNEGNPLQTGALYYNTATNNLWAWNGATWVLTNNFNEFTNFVSNGTTASRSLVERFGEISNVSDFGADGTGATPSNVAVAAMAAVKGYLVFPQGSFLLNTITISVPIYFEMGSNITANNRAVVTINNLIESPRQYIFQKTGSGSYVLGHSNVTGTGENARQIHASWFGAFPSAIIGSDQSPFIQDACNAVGNTREARIVFDIGNYNMLTSVSVPRCCQILGQGIRRTIFKIKNDGFSAFTTLGNGARFTGIQFELHDATRTAPFITLNHENCIVDEVNVGRSNKGIVVNARDCEISNIGGLWTSMLPIGSSAIEINNGNCRVENLFFLSSANGPEALVAIGSFAVGDISMVSISGITYNAPSIGILFNAVNGNITRCYLEGFIYNGFSGPNPSYAIDIKCDNSFGIGGIVLESGVITSYATNGIRISQAGSGGIEELSINNIIIQGATGVGIDIRQSGTNNIRNISVGAGTGIKERATPIQVTGFVFDLKVDPNALPNAKNAACYDFEIENNSAVSIDLYQQVYTGFLLVSVGSAKYGVYIIRAASTPTFTTMSQSANMNPVTTSLIGTTGPAGDFSVGVTNRYLYLENRLGDSQRVSATILTGV
jgi:hypothetical protein